MSWRAGPRTMPTTALLLVLLAALLHAGWNLWIKRAGVDAGIVFVWGTTGVAALVLAPLAWLVGAFAPPPEAASLAVADAQVGRIARLADWPVSIWIAVAVSAVVHTVYFRALQRGYAVGDLSVVYPVARGTGPLLASIGAIIWLDEPASTASLAGLACVVIGIFVTAGGASPARMRSDPRARRGLSWGLAIGALIALYTVNDGRAVAQLGVHPLVYYWAISVVQALLLAPWVMRSQPAWPALLARSRRVIVGVGVVSSLGYVLVLEAMRLAPVSVIAPAREVSMLVAALAGAVWLREGQLGRRLAGATLIVVGVALLAGAG